jgi:hypothetical protein
MTTDRLYSATHSALCQGRWGVARGLLETLAGRHDSFDALADLEAYADKSGVPLDGELYAALSYRLGRCNAVAMRNRTEWSPSAF